MGMTKIVVNKCFGGFGLSVEAIKRLQELRGKSYNEEYNKISVKDDFRGKERTDPLLIQVVEELGDKASSRYANLKIIEIPDGIDWEIDEYDGLETIHEVHRSWG